MAVRLKRRTVTVVLRPFSLRQLRWISLQLADPLQLATGLDQKQLAEAGKVSPQQLAQLQTLISAVNAWDPKDLAQALEQEESRIQGPTEAETVQTLHHYAPELIAAGHDPERIWDYTPEQYCFYLRAARKAALEKQRQFVNGVATAVAGVATKQGAVLFDTYTTRIEEALKALDKPTEAKRG